YPDRPIKFLVPFSAGSSTDIAARAYAEVTTKAIKGASVVVENRAGAGGNVGAAVIARSAPDGYSLLYSAATPYAIAPFVYPDLSYNPI
ncbi:tripartite tricarboxylate transporter substrate-binding protein, partial [Bordetella pertussis]